MNVPKSATYDIKAYSKEQGIDKDYTVSIYADVCVVQNINIVPNSDLGVGEF